MPPAPTISANAASAEPVGVIGLGTMGAPMAANLLAAGRRVVITGRGAERYADLVSRGAQWRDTPREVAAEVGSMVLMLPDLPQVEAVLDGTDGVLAAEPERLLLILCSTTSPVGVRELAADLDRRTAGRVRLVDAPVSGGQDGAEAGTLSIMVGGDDADADHAAAVLSPCGTPVHLGPLGSGQVAKACNQMIVAATVLALGEAAVLADRSGLDLERLFSVLAGGYAGSRILATRGDRIVAQDYAPSGAARYMVKDLDSATEVAQATGTRPALLPALRAAFVELTDSGLGDDDIAVTRRFVEQR